jgi:outer membrane protein assembly factor BamB
MKYRCLALLCAATLGAAGCHALGKGDYGWIGGPTRPKEGQGALSVRWRRELTPAARGVYRPVENAVAAIDSVHGRIYVGARSGELHALRFDGTSLYHFELHEPIECEPALDVEKDELYVANERSELFGLKPSTGEIRWKASTLGSVRRQPALFKDALYVVTEEDSVEALSRADGSRLWTYRRERGEGFLVAGHAGLRLSDDGLLYAAFNDGVVVALDALDGRARWERSTAEDVPDTDPGRPRYIDADATPVLLGDRVFAASFAGGLYCLDARNGSVIWREAGWTGITGMESTADGALILVSGDHGVVRFDPALREARWVKALERGSLGTPRIASDLVLIGDSRGSLFALHVATGDELGRIDAGHGFVAPAAVKDRHGFVVTNGGVLLALRVLGADPTPLRSGAPDSAAP